MAPASRDMTAIGQPDASEAKYLKRAGLLMAVSDLLWVPQAGLIAWALGTLLGNSVSLSQQQDAREVMTYALVAAIGIVLIAVLRLFIQHQAAILARRMARAIQSRARADLLSAAIACSPAAGFPASGAFAAHVSDQVDLIGPYYRNYAPQLMRLKAVPVGIVIVTLYFSWMAAMILLISGPLIPVFMALIGTKAKAASADQQEELTRLSGSLLDRIKGMETLTLFGAIPRTRQEIADAGERFRIGTMRVLKIAFLSSTVLELFSALGIAFCAVYVGFSLLGDIKLGTWGAPLGFSAGLFVLLLAPEFFAPLRSFAAAYHDRAAGLAAQEKLGSILTEIRKGEKFLSQQTQRLDSGQLTGPKCILSAPPAICFERVSLELSGHTVFNDLKLDIASGETVILTGESGSGKTALLDCLLGFHQPDGGTVWISGQPALEVASYLRRNVIWLGQSPRLFHGSLRANLVKGLAPQDPVLDDDIWAALRLAGADGLVERLPNGLATALGEDGFGLSVGEIRRVALARAAMRKNATVLLADEPTAGLDEDTAADVIAGLKALASERTAIIATHDPTVLTIEGRQLDMRSLGAVAVREVAV